MLKKSVKSLLANFKEMSINKFIAFKASCPFPSLPLQLIFSPSPPLFPGQSPLPCRHTRGNRIFYCTGKALSVPHEGRLEVEFPLPFRQQKDRPITSFTTIAPTYGQARSNTHSKQPLTLSWYSFIAPKSVASLPQLNLSPQHDDKTLANVSPTLSGAREKQPLERSPSQTNTGLHQGFPQTSTHFSVPAMGSFSPSNTHKHIYIQTKAKGKWISHRVFQERDHFYHFV